MSIKIENWVLPLSILAGVLFYKIIDPFSFLIPALLIVMLFITYCGLSLREVKIRRLHFALLAIQVGLSLLAYYIIGFFDPISGQSALICVLAPTALTASVVTSILGGELAVVVSYTLFSNLSMALIIPALLAALDIKSDLAFFSSFLFFLKQLVPLLILPFIGTFLLFKFYPKGYQTVRNFNKFTIYMWAISLAILMARSVTFLLGLDDNNIKTLTLIIFGSLLLCILQFWFGRRVGHKFGSVISGGQALGHKNSVLAIWIAQSYMTPIASIGPAFYVIWQNIFNTYQLWKFRKLKSK